MEGGNTMGRVDIRNVPDEHLVIIDELARAQKLSRGMYLKSIIEKIVREEMLYKQSEKFSIIVEKATEAVTINNRILERFLQEESNDE